MTERVEMDTKSVGETNGGVPAPFSERTAEVRVELNLPWERANCAHCMQIAARAIAEANNRVEHQERIALALQKTLLPARWTTPGIDIATCYKAGSDEALIGGDFYDVFEIEPGVSAFVVGDVCGKGLQAAGHISSITQMLRYAIYSNSSLCDAISELNAIITQRHLLPAFATLFIGAFHSATREFRYISCGHEPAMLARRDPRLKITMLNPTGPVLGAFPNSKFEERSFTLQSGDGVIVYTDGIVECGKVRSDQLTEVRMANSLLQAYTGLSAGEVVEVLYKAAEAHAGKHFPDDLCLLAAIVADGANH